MPDLDQAIERAAQMGAAIDEALGMTVREQQDMLAVYREAIRREAVAKRAARRLLVAHGHDPELIPR